MRDLLLAYNSSGFQVLAFPCNQFGGQAPATDECERNYTYRRMQLPFAPPSFTIFDKVEVNGPSSLPLFRFLKTHPVMQHTSAIKNERFIKLRYEELTPGPANIAAIDKLARALHPDAF